MANGTDDPMEHTGFATFNTKQRGRLGIWVSASVKSTGGCQGDGTIEHCLCRVTSITLLKLYVVIHWKVGTRYH